MALLEQPQAHPPQGYQAEEGQGGQGGPAGHPEGQGWRPVRKQQQLSQVQADGVQLQEQRHHGEAHIVAGQNGSAEAAHYLGSKGQRLEDLSYPTAHHDLISQPSQAFSGLLFLETADFMLTLCQEPEWL